MVDIVFARALHVLAIVIWIGGVFMVTVVLLPMIKRTFPLEERIPVFHKIENRFANIARLTTLLAGLSGLYMIWRMHLWSRFTQETISFWWMHAMVCVWFIFSVMLFVVEPFFLHRKLRQKQQDTPVKTYNKLQTMHWILLTIALITIIGAVMGSYGYQF